MLGCWFQGGFPKSYENMALGKIKLKTPLVLLREQERTGLHTEF